MAEPSTPPPAVRPTTAPALPSTADTVPYVPVSWMAVAAMGFAGVFAVTLLIAGWWARTERRPLLLDWLLILPVVAIVLSFAARRIIRNAEGTRTGVLFGMDLPNTAWWTAVVLGLGYAAYMIAINYSIRRDAEAEVERWAGFVLKDDITRAFHRTQDPNQRATTRADDTAALENRWRTEFVAFRQSDLVRYARRNPGQCTFAVGGLREWAYKPGGIEATVTGTLTCPEGKFPVQVQLRGVEAGVGEQAAGRQWQVIPPSGFGGAQIAEVRRTPYGWFVLDLERQGDQVGRQFVQMCADRTARPAAFVAFADLGKDPMFRALTPEAQFARMAGAPLFAAPGATGVVGTAAALAWTPPPALYAATANRLFTLPGGAEPSAVQKEQLLFAWEKQLGIVPAGARLDKTPDVNDLMAFTDTGIEVRVPVEIPNLQNPNPRDIAAARGRLVVVCTDPEARAEADRLRKAANPDQATTAPPDDLRRRPYPWKVLRVETDMASVSAKPAGPGGGPPDPGMMGGH
jgi:hypothetical protein